jgi:hypothetical protein
VREREGGGEAASLGEETAEEQEGEKNVLAFLVLICRGLNYLEWRGERTRAGKAKKLRS